MKPENIKIGVIGLFAVVSGFLCKAFYRNYININKIDDYGVAGFLPSYFYVVGFSLLLLIRPTKIPKTIVLIVTAASILFELKQWKSSGNFDLQDILASIAGGLTAILVFKVIEKKKD